MYTALVFLALRVTRKMLMKCTCAGISAEQGHCRGVTSLFPSRYEITGNQVGPVRLKETTADPELTKKSQFCQAAFLRYRITISAQQNDYFFPLVWHK